MNNMEFILNLEESQQNMANHRIKNYYKFLLVSSIVNALFWILVIAIIKFLAQKLSKDNKFGVIVPIEDNSNETIQTCIDIHIDRNTCPVNQYYLS